MRRSPTATRASKLARLEQRVTELHRARVPAAIVLPVFADDAEEDADAYAADLNAHLATAAPGTTIVLIMRGGARPVGMKPPWSAPRSWLDPPPGP